ncbi:glycerol-3-phosphate responsive antiterminator GlpP [Halobacillus litoralis]|uniref:Glycerol uptake operon antiterminator regulatory protein n=1 Tax=Halobacillus litoralis TaxID=45668 RepID=A0A845DTQ1_9BACI|nr:MULTISPECIES: glycerol-3-phosphate responsive antiterminator [Halobacillus]MCA1021323.1 glycerol-3-phosphate responsive antiterminator [Halobacillus litoralis]MYL21011.1 glycerol-3-phosphate responsive antiterminator GlpP [Halobacillus litoralis]MYL31450.1 glycerol-3-phosphate responsive antiterminator GlpP [Halobacillus halophilus]MYL38395.1 glycerol-3-phosphate responsive antiterminator GlpP [Halobacillus litoralis]
MSFTQTVLPAVKRIKEFEALLESDTEYIILLESRLGLLRKLVRLGQKSGKKVLVHVDLIQGLKADDYGMEYLGQEVKPDGVISTRGHVIHQAKKYNILSVQRLFLIDSQAIEHNVKLIQRTEPDYVEVLPGIVPGMIKEIKERIGVPVIAGGLVRTQEDVEQALASGASAVSTSRTDLWKFSK